MLKFDNEENTIIIIIRREQWLIREQNTRIYLMIILLWV